MVTVVEAAYLAPFVVATLACLVSVVSALRIRDEETRRGLVGLLLLSGAWAAIEGGRVVTETVAIGGPVYVAGLTVGFATVFAWLYFVSAYTGRDYHRRRSLRLGGLGLYLGVVTLKLTNPIHGWYYSLTPVTEPFPHVAVTYGPINWIVLSVAYLLSVVGFVWLTRFFSASPWNTRTLAMLAGVTLLPVAGTLAGRLTGVVVALNYEPLGVAAFAIGTLFVVLDSFRATLGEYGGAIDRITDAVIVVDENGVIRRHNATAREAFPGLADTTGPPLADGLPAVAAARTSARRIHEIRDRHWLVRETDVSLGPHAVGCTIICTDVTELRRHQSELDRQNRQLEQFAEAITHELRNALAITDGHLGRLDRLLADVERTSESSNSSSASMSGSSESSSGSAGTSASTTDDAVRISRSTITTAIEATGTARDGLDRARRIVDDLTTLTRMGQTVRPTEYEPCSLARRARAGTADAGVTCVVDDDATIEADPARLEYLFDCAGTFGAANGASRLVVTPTADGFTIADDGGRPAETDGLFAYGDAVPDAETGMLLPMVATLADVHGWRVEHDAAYADGVRYTIHDASVDCAETDAPATDRASS